MACAHEQVGARWTLARADPLRCQAHGSHAIKTKPGTGPGFGCCLQTSDQFWTFSSVRRFFSLLQAGKVCGVGSSGRLSP